uniref:Uncharacterized protein n=1 Tax=Anguilla anguilla TaxID=7936 RepID=A0A0E9WT46_ANGAN
MSLYETSLSKINKPSVYILMLCFASFAATVVTTLEDKTKQKKTARKKLFNYPCIPKAAE